MTFIILALDGLDAGLVEHWDIEKLKLNRHREIETFNYGFEDPYTLEVWPTIATGLHPEEHGITAKNSSDWGNPILSYLSKFGYLLPSDVQSRLGTYIESVTSSDFSLAETSERTFFDGPKRTVENWPGVKDSHKLEEVWKMGSAGYSKSAFRREVLGKAAGQIAWADEILRHDPVLAGVHVHALDVFGHAYTEKTKKDTHASGKIQDLKQTYDEISNMVAGLVNSLSDSDELLILSDHGITNEIVDTPNADFGSHSFRAFAATTLEDPLPKDVYEVYDWVEARVENAEEEEVMEMPKARLRELGYIE